MKRKLSGDGKLFCVSLPGRGCYDWVPVKLISRLILYPLCLYVAIWCWGEFRDGYENMQLDRFSVELDEGEGLPATVGGEPSAEVNLTPTNAPPAKVEKARPAKTQPSPRGGKTNQVGIAGQTEPPEKKGGMMVYFSGMLGALLVFALLVARDLGHLIGERVGGNYVTKSEKSQKADMYEDAEAIWADGAYVDAIDSFREYIKVYPGEYHAYKRIAEIYEKDLGSFRAAALEYEEMLEMKAPPARWGWTAIHLCNLYSGKLDDPDRALALLKRVASECSDTTAGQKARDRLAKIDAG
jgi:TolA-binding protein